MLILYGAYIRPFSISARVNIKISEFLFFGPPQKSLTLAIGLKSKNIRTRRKN